MSSEIGTIRASIAAASKAGKVNNKGKLGWHGHVAHRASRCSCEKLSSRMNMSKLLFTALSEGKYHLLHQILKNYIRCLGIQNGVKFIAKFKCNKTIVITSSRIELPLI